MMQRLRILLVSTSYPLRENATAGVFVRRMVESLPAPCQATVLCPADTQPELVSKGTFRYALLPFRYAPRSWQVLAQEPGGVIPSLKAMPWRVLLIPLLFGVMGWRLFREARRNDLVHANWAVCGAVAAIAAKLRHRPLVVTLRGDDVTLAERRRLHRFMLNVAIRHADCVVCVAWSMHAALSRLYPQYSARLEVVLNGVSEVFLRVALPAVREGGMVELLAVGSLIRRKGYDLLLTALARIESRSWRLVLIGEGPERESLMELARRLGVDVAVRFLGSISPEDMPCQYAKCDLVVFPSRSEGRPNVVLEAMAAARPVVAFSIPGVTDLVTSEVGWLVEPGSVSAYASALEEAIGNARLRQHRGEAARRRVISSGGTWEATGRAYAKIYRRALLSQTYGRS